MESRVPATIGSYRIVRKLGQGGMGIVYLAQDERLARQVALKVLVGELGADGERRQRFLREARAAAGISHPNVVPVHATGEDGDAAWIAMEYLQGGSLGDLLKARGKIGAEQAIGFMLQATAGLQAAWRKGIVHRDVKPDNILLHEDGYVKLADFGLSKVYGSGQRLTQSGAILGSPPYMSPEQVEGRALDFRSDIYSLGATFFHLVTGRHAFPSSQPIAAAFQHVTAPAPSVRQAEPSVPQPLARIIERMLQKSQDARYASYEDLTSALENVRAQLRPAPASPVVSEPSPADATVAARIAPPRLSYLTADTVELPPGRSARRLLVAGAAAAIAPAVGMVVMLGLAGALWMGRTAKEIVGGDSEAAPSPKAAEPSPAGPEAAPSPGTLLGIPPKAALPAIGPAPADTPRPPAGAPLDKRVAWIYARVRAVTELADAGDYYAAEKQLEGLDGWCRYEKGCPAELMSAPGAMNGYILAKWGKWDEAARQLGSAWSNVEASEARVPVFREGGIRLVPIWQHLREVFEAHPIHWYTAAYSIVPDLDDHMAQLDLARLIDGLPPSARPDFLVPAAYRAVLHGYPPLEVKLGASDRLVEILLHRSLDADAVDHLKSLVSDLENQGVSWKALNDQLVFLGIAQARLGEKDEARATFEKARAMTREPGDPVRIPDPGGLVERPSGEAIARALAELS